MSGLTRRDVLRGLTLGGAAALWPATRGLAAPRGAGDPLHRVQIDAPILADDPVAVPLTIAVDHPMAPDHYIRRLEVTLATDPVPRKGVFLFTPASGRPSVAYQMRSGQGGELTVVGECTRHGRFEATHTVRVAPGGCAVPAGGPGRERGGTPTLRTEGRVRPGQVVPVWASLRHASHTGLVERKGTFVQERPAFYVERLAVFLDGERVSEFLMTPAVSPDPKVRFFVRAEPGKTLRVVFGNNRGEQWEASQRLG